VDTAKLSKNARNKAQNERFVFVCFYQEHCDANMN